MSRSPGFRAGCASGLRSSALSCTTRGCVLLDEPFTGLDDSATAALIDRLGGLRALGCIVLVVTHDLEIVEKILDRAVMLREGRMVPLEAGTASLRERVRQAGLQN